MNLHVPSGFICCAMLVASTAASARPTDAGHTTSGCASATACHVARIQVPHSTWQSGYVRGGAGYSIALANDRLVIGAPFAGISVDCPSGCGAVELLRRDGTQWILELQLGTGGTTGGLTGLALALSDDHVAVAQPQFDCESAGDCGAVRILRRAGAGWTPAATLTSPEPEMFGEFGNALAFDGDALIIGAGATDAGAANAGAVYIFRRSDELWSHVQTLTPRSARLPV